MVTAHIIKTEEKLLFILSPCLLKVSEYSFSCGVWKLNSLLIIYYQFIISFFIFSSSQTYVTLLFLLVSYIENFLFFIQKLKHLYQVTPSCF